MQAWPDGYGRIVLDETDSTNDEARRRAPGLDGPAWIMAYAQTRARGREGRAWAAPRGNLSASLVMPLDGAPAEAATLSFDAALAVADLAGTYAPEAAITLKWPNDVLLDGAKLAGILLESWVAAGRRMLVIGIGVNLASHPPASETRWPATSLAVHGRAPEPDEALTTLANAFARWQEVRARDGFAAIRAAWVARAAQRGGAIEVRLPQETIPGTFEDVDPDGRLLLRTAAGLRRIAAGDVFFGAG